MAVGTPLLVVAQPFARKTKLNITAKTLVKATPGFIGTLVVDTAPSAAGGVYDSSTTAGTAAANLISTIGTTAQQPIQLNFPALNGIVVDPGTGGVVALSFN